MDLLDGLAPEHRARLARGAATVRLAPGELLLRRGEAGGDLFRLTAGTLEVIDARVEPPVVLAVVGPGATLGEMAFVDGSVRSADVRAAEECVCQHWQRDELLALLEAEPTLGLAFYRALTDVVTAHSRNLRAVVLDGGRRRTTALDQTADELVGQLRRRLLAVEPTLRTRAEGARAEVLDAFDTFFEGFVPISQALPVHARESVLVPMGEALRPWLIRSQLGELLTAPPSGATDDALVHGHLRSGHPMGDGDLGALVDEWLLRLPTARGLQDRAEALLACVLDRAPDRLTVVNGDPTGLSTRLRTERPAADLDRLDGAPLTAWVLGDTAHEIGDRQVVALDGVLDSLPDRLAAPALAAARSWLAPGGRVVGTSLLPTRDAHLFRYVLGWPQVHRTERATEVLLEAAGLTDLQLTRCGVGLCWHATAPA